MYLQAFAAFVNGMGSVTDSKGHQTWSYNVQIVVPDKEYIIQAKVTSTTGYKGQSVIIDGFLSH